MTVVPLPESPALRVSLDYLNNDNSLAGNRFYIGYSGAAPTAGNCATLASDIATAWNTSIAPLCSPEWSLREVDVIDIASDSGASGQWTGTDNGTRSGSTLPSQVAANVEYDIARRYRGGKPRIFWPAGASGDLETPATWTTGFVTSLNTETAAFFAAIAALSIGALGSLSHVNLSYYKGFTNITNSSGRTRAVPTYRAAALVEPIASYAAKGLLSSQRRRRAAVTY